MTQILRLDLIINEAASLAVMEDSGIVPSNKATRLQDLVQSLIGLTKDVPGINLDPIQSMNPGNLNAANYFLHQALKITRGSEAFKVPHSITGAPTTPEFRRFMPEHRYLYLDGVVDSNTEIFTVTAPYSAQITAEALKAKIAAAALATEDKASKAAMIEGLQEKFEMKVRIAGKPEMTHYGQLVSNEQAVLKSLQAKRAEKGLFASLLRADFEAMFDGAARASLDARIKASEAHIVDLQALEARDKAHLDLLDPQAGAGSNNPPVIHQATPRNPAATGHRPVKPAAARAFVAAMTLLAVGGVGLFAFTAFNAKAATNAKATEEKKSTAPSTQRPPQLPSERLRGAR